VEGRARVPRSQHGRVRRDAIERVPSAGEQKAAEWEGWNTVVWTHDGSEWKARTRSGRPAASRPSARCGTRPIARRVGFKQTANQHLIDTVKGRKRGRARTSRWAGPQRGVPRDQRLGRSPASTSRRGIRVAKEAACEGAGQADDGPADNETYDFGKDRWELVTLIYAGNDPTMIERNQAEREEGRVVRRRVLPQGRHRGDGDRWFTDGELATLFTGWTILKDEVVDDIADWGLRKVKLVRFARRSRKLGVHEPVRIQGSARP